MCNLTYGHYSIYFECRRARINANWGWINFDLNQNSNGAHQTSPAVSSLIWNWVLMYLKLNSFANTSKNVSYRCKLRDISKVQKLGPRPWALAFQNNEPGQKPPSGQSSGLAWPGFWPQAKASTSLAAMMGGGDCFWERSSCLMKGRHNIKRDCACVVG